MGLNCGIVGLPNVGKSTLFNALTQTAAAEAANYPFCTIEPNMGCVGVPDERLAVLARMAQSKKIIPTQVEFVDIAGLVKGASRGEGLGNQFLGHIKATDAILHVLRCFEDEDISHVEGSVDPLRDFETIETELILADLEHLEKRMSKMIKKPHMTSKESAEQAEMMQKALELLQAGKALRPPKGTKSMFQELELLSDKPMVLVANVSEKDAISGNAYTMRLQEFAQKNNLDVVIISAAIEAEMAALSIEEQAEFLKSLGLEEKGLAKVIRSAYSLLHLSTFFTVGPEETHAWAIKKDCLAPDAAAEIHTDFKKGFVCVATISYADYVACGGETEAKSAGKMRLEGKDYKVQDGDILHFRFNV
ncbi:ribosome-binding ATPase YchF [Alphaproteobacteria bacterium]|nr:ribosome-binding ATPase YchF [Alphaproteobacteria bacterium]GHS97924.1 ribosome-binding ATPase YchF [Alphaproteobacteria bacterium]